MTRLHWTEVPLLLVSLEEAIAPGADVPGRIVVMELVRRDGRGPGFEVAAKAGDVDWTGLDAALAWLEAQDVAGPPWVLAGAGSGQRPCVRRPGAARAAVSALGW